jgi:hypothetical protein
MMAHYVDRSIAGEKPPLPPSTPTLEDLRIEAIENRKLPTLSKFLDSYLSGMNYGKEHIYVLRRACDSFIEFLGRDPRIDQVSDDQIRKWHQSLKCRPTAATKLSIAVRTIVRFAVEQKIRGPLVVKPQNQRGGTK